MRYHSLLLAVVLLCLVTLGVASPTHRVRDEKSKKKRGPFDKIKGDAFDGIGTYYNPGPGSCGKTDTDDELVVAINRPQMHNGANPNVNPHCNKYVYIKGSDGETKARIEDTCPACPDRCLDLSPAAFKAVCGDLTKGKCSISWKFM